MCVPGRQPGMVPQVLSISDPELAEWVRPAGQRALDTCLSLFTPYRGDKQEPLSLPPVYSAQFGEFCLFVFMFIYWWGMHMEVRILVQVVSLLPSGGFWGLNSAPQFEGQYLSREAILLPLGILEVN